MPEFCVVAFDRIGISFSFRNRITAPVIPQGSIHIEGVTEIPVGFGRMVNNGLNNWLRTFPGDFPAQNTSGFSVYKCYEVDTVFLSPMYVKISSNSAVSISAGTGAFGNCSACSFAQLATVW